MKPLLATAILSLTVAASAVAAPPDLRGGTPAEWEAAFGQGAVSDPLGLTRSTVLYTDGRLPRVKATLQGAVWKGKLFPGDGTFTNLWVGGVRAGHADTAVEPSWLDGQPVLAVHYPPTALVFSRTRDELREVSPGVWLGRSFDTATGTPKSWFLLRGR